MDSFSDEDGYDAFTTRKRTALSDDNDSDSEKQVSSDDDDMIEFVRRRGYTTFENSDLDNGNKKRLTKEDNLYGVFAEDDSSDDEKSGKRKGPRRKGGGIPWKDKSEKSANGGMTFVKSSAFTNTDNSVKKPLENENQAKNSETETTPAETERQRQEIEQDQKRKEEIQKANERFQALLAKGTTPSLERRTRVLASKPAEHEFHQAPSLKQSAQHSANLGHDNLQHRQDVGLNTASPAVAFTSMAAPPMSLFLSTSKMTSFGYEQSQPQRATTRDPNLGTWEKHTKGLGMKLLTKMGYGGTGGLGAKRIRTAKPTAPLSIDIDAALPVSREALGANGLGSQPQAETETKNEAAVKYRKGISRPVEVIVRPANLGLGFGSFQEASRLKANRQIEAEVRGIDFKDQEEEERKRKTLGSGNIGRSDGMGDVQASLLPSTQSLLSSGEWRKGIGSTRTQRRDGMNGSRKFVSYQDILLGNDTAKKDVVIDMRGPAYAPIDTNKDSGAATGIVALGEELLHNVTFLLNWYENKLHSTNHFVQSSKRKVASLKLDLEGIERRKRVADERILKLEKVLVILDQIDTIVAAIQGNRKGETPGQQLQWKDVNDLIHQLGEQFSADERVSLQFFDVLVPSLLAPIVEQMLAIWNPLSDSSVQSQAILSSIMNLCRTGEHDREDASSVYATRRVIFIEHVLTKIKRCLQSTRWDPIESVEAGVTLFEQILDFARRATPPPTTRVDHEASDEDLMFENPFADISRDGITLENVVKDEVMFDVIFPKLCRALGQWKAVFMTNGETEKKGLANPPHMWLAPWLPHLDYRNMLNTILPDVKRKLRSALSVLSKSYDSTTDDFVFFDSCTRLLKPWRGFFEMQTMHDLTSECVTPRLGRHLARIVVLKSPLKQKWEGVDFMLDLYNSGLLSSRELLSLVEGEIMLNWAEALHAWLESKVYELVDVIDFYAAWKRRLFYASKTNQSHSVANLQSWMVLRQDAMICRLFYGGLLMIKAAAESNESALDELIPTPRDASNYRIVQARRAKENRLREEEEELRGRVDAASNATKPFVASAGNGVTFREVVEDFAHHHDLPFRPKLGGGGVHPNVDGKQIFLFGDVQIYLDSNVVFALRGSKWQPTSLDELASSS